MLSSMVDNVLIMVVDSDTSQELWEKLAELFMSQSKARYMPLKLHIQTTKKWEKKIAERLAIGGNPDASTDFIIHLLTALDDSYESLVTTRLARMEKDNLTIEEVYSLILSHETRIEMIKERSKVKWCMTCQLILLKKDKITTNSIMLIRETLVVEMLLD